MESKPSAGRDRRALGEVHPFENRKTMHQTSSQPGPFRRDERFFRGTVETPRLGFHAKVTLTGPQLRDCKTCVGEPGEETHIGAACGSRRSTRVSESVEATFICCQSSVSFQGAQPFTVHNLRLQ